MKRPFILTFLLFLFGSCSDSTRIENSNNEGSTSRQKSANQVTVYETFEDLAPIFKNESDTTYVVNFWATTCPPCLKEMPHFAELKKKYDAEKLRVILVSLDLKEHLHSRVLPYIKKHKIVPEVVLLADQNYSKWTDEIDTSWYGALPATFIVNNEKTHFSFGAYESFEDLNQEVKPFMSSY